MYELQGAEDWETALDMWSYWEEKYGVVEALQEYYPRLLESRSDLQAAVIMIQNGERIIKSIMEESHD